MPVVHRHADAGLDGPLGMAAVVPTAPPGIEFRDGGVIRAPLADDVMRAGVGKRSFADGHASEGAFAPNSVDNPRRESTTS